MDVVVGEVVGEDRGRCVADLEVDDQLGRARREVDLLARSVGYVKQRKQFGRAIGEYQALKHALADVRIGLDFARPLVFGAAVTGSSRDASAAKVAASEAAYRAARTALQVHGAIGYTAEHDLGLWLLKVRALVGAWGSPSVHRARVLASLVEDR